MTTRTKILLVEDDEILNQLTCEIIEMLKYEPITALRAEEGLELFKEHKQEILLAIIDMNLDEISGVELFKELKIVDPKLVGILASGMITEEDKEEYLERGFTAVVSKPYSITELKKLVAEIAKERI